MMRMANICFKLLLIGGLIFSAASLNAKEPSQPEAVAERVAKVRPHPRLFWEADSETRIRELIREDARLKAAWDSVRLMADYALTEPPVVYRKEGRRLLGRSREALARILNLGMAYRLTGESKYLNRAIAEVRAMAEMPDWNPSHFLDTAEMTLAMAVAYDWFHDRLPPEVREIARQAIEEKGLGPYLKPGAKHGWEKGGNNWNQVCHAGMLAGALALAQEDPERAVSVVRRALAGLPYSMKVYEPDGNYPEGPGYWNYGTTFNVIAISMIESALGSDFGLTSSPGFLLTGNFPLHTTGPTRLPFNFSDCGTGAGFNPAAVWFAARTGKPELLYFQWELMDHEAAAVRARGGRPATDRNFPLMLLWATEGLAAREPKDLAWFARGENPLAIFRTSWRDRDAIYLAIKAGTPSASHGHMDIGSFVLDALGERWSIDLGTENYNKLEQRGISLWNRQQGSERWSIFRYHNRGHSTLVVNDAEQNVAAKAPIVDFSAGAGNSQATVDMTKTYAGQLASAQRCFSLSHESRTVTIQDDLRAGASAAQVRWGMVTRASLEPAGSNRARLLLNGKVLEMRVLSPERVTLKSWPADPPPMDYDSPNPGVRVIGFEVPLKPKESAVLKVVFRPAP
jgi:hypothetical protein